MAEPRTDPLDRVSFRCKACGHAFARAPDRVEDAPERDWHPWVYFAVCPDCEAEAPQAGWEKGLMAAYVKATGPRTPEGKAKVAENLAGHPTPEEAQRTRFNAMKHGLHAKTAAYFPAKPGKYPHCTGCAHLETLDCLDYGACLVRAELLLKHLVAFERRDPDLLRDLRAHTQANVQALIEDMILAIAQDGVRQKTPVWYYDREGAFHLARVRRDPAGGLDDEIEGTVPDGEWSQIYELSEHPLLKRLADFMAKNSMTLADLDMTPRQQTQDDMVQGFLDGQRDERESALEYQERTSGLLEQLSEQIRRSRDNLARDPVLIEHRQADDDDAR